MRVVVLGIADRVGRRLRAKGRMGSKLTLRARFPGPRSVSRSCSLPGPTASTATLYEIGTSLLTRAREASDRNRPTPWVSVSGSGPTRSSVGARCR